MAQYIVETPEQSESHGAQLAALLRLADRLLSTSQQEVLDVETGLCWLCARSRGKRGCSGFAFCFRVIFAVRGEEISH